VAYINVSGSGDFATLVVSTSTISSIDTATMIVIPGMQNITLNNGNGVFRWKQLDSTSEYAIAIAATNQVSMNIVLDSASFFGDGSGDVTAIDKGLFKLSNDKTLVKFRLYWQGTGSGDKYVSGEGYFTGLAPSVSADQPLWVSPLTIDVAGDFASGTVSA
jgi:hypothetical protein